jgi:hypothetical protein
VVLCSQLKNRQENTLGAQLLVPTEISFNRRQAHPLQKTSKALSKEIESIIEKLLKLCNSQDEKTSERACSKLLDYHIEMISAIEKDEITRKLLSIKHGNGSRDLEESDNMPMIDFNSIQNIE